MAGHPIKPLFNAVELSPSLTAAFPLTLPVMAGFLFLGIAYGTLMTLAGCGVFWTFLTSWMVFGGSIQYLAIALFAAPFNPMYALALTLMVNARHVFYGFSLLDRIRRAGKLKAYIIFALCDETFSIISSTEAPDGVDDGLFMFFIALLNRWYWIGGSVIGALIGSVLPFNTRGLEFSLTAMFAVIFIGNLTNPQNRLNSAVGVLCSALCLVIWGGGGFIIPSMLLILAVLLLLSRRDREESRS